MPRLYGYSPGKADVDAVGVRFGVKPFDRLERYAFELLLFARVFYRGLSEEFRLPSVVFQRPRRSVLPWFRVSYFCNFNLNFSISRVHSITGPSTRRYSDSVSSIILSIENVSRSRAHGPLRRSTIFARSLRSGR